MLSDCRTDAVRLLLAHRGLTELVVQGFDAISWQHVQPTDGFDHRAPVSEVDGEDEILVDEIVKEKPHGGASQTHAPVRARA